MPSTQCSAIARNGNRCKRNCKVGDQTCAIHTIGYVKSPSRKIKSPSKGNYKSPGRATKHSKSSIKSPPKDKKSSVVIEEKTEDNPLCISTLVFKPPVPEVAEEAELQTATQCDIKDTKESKPVVKKKKRSAPNVFFSPTRDARTHLPCVSTMASQERITSQLRQCAKK